MAAETCFSVVPRESGDRLFAGIIVALFASIALPGIGGLVGICAVVGGWLIGRTIGADVCSERTCRHVLEPHVEECPGCKGVISGRIRAAHEHYSAAADVRRELAAAMLAEDGNDKKRAKKKPRPVKPRSAEVPSRRPFSWILMGIIATVALAGLWRTVSNELAKKSSAQTTRPNTNVASTPAAKPEVLEGKTTRYQITVPNPALWKQVPSVPNKDMVIRFILGARLAPK